MTAQQQYTEHLLGFRRAEVAFQLEHEGYKLEWEAPLDGQRADIVARKPEAKTLVYEFKLPDNLRKSSEQIRGLRRAAADQGYEFKLVVVTPPKRIDVSVRGLEQTLTEAFQNHFSETGLDSVASFALIENITDVEITSLDVHGGFADVEGHGIVSVRLESGGGEERDGVTSYDTFPFEYQITLDPQQHVVGIPLLHVDTSSF